MSTLTGMTNIRTKMNIAPQYKKIDIEDIRPNKFNKAEIVDIDELADSIHLYGLQKPLEVYYDEDKDIYTLIGGERRFTALQKLLEEDRLEDYDIPCLVIPKPEDITKERLMIILSNAQRAETEETRLAIVQELLDILDSQPSLLDGYSGKKRDWIGSFIGRKGRTVQKYINMIRNEEYEEDDDVAKGQMSLNDFTREDDATEDGISSSLTTMPEEHQEGKPTAKQEDRYKKVKKMLSKIELSRNCFEINSEEETATITLSINDKKQFKKLKKLLEELESQ